MSETDYFNDFKQFASETKTTYPILSETLPETVLNKTEKDHKLDQNSFSVTEYFKDLKPLISETSIFKPILSETVFIQDVNPIETKFQFEQKAMSETDYFNDFKQFASETKSLKPIIFEDSSYNNNKFISKKTFSLQGRITYVEKAKIDVFFDILLL